jgi:hypothetical protein
MRLWSPPKPSEENFDRDRKISDSKPIFSLEQIQKSISAEQIRVLRNAETDLEGLQWTEKEVALLIKALTPEDYLGSEWTQAGHGTKWEIDCDVYKVRVNDDFLRHRVSPAYYVKFSQRESGLVVVVRLHLDR